MSEKTEQPGKSGAPPSGSAGKKPSPIIDLTATVVPTGKPAASAAPAQETRPSEPPKAPEAPKASAPPPKAMPPGPVPPARSGGGWASHMAAGLLGALVAAVGAPQLGPLLGVDLAPPSIDVTNRLTVLEQAGKVAASQSPQQASRLAASEARITKLEQDTQAALARLTAQSTALDARIASAGAGEAAERLGRIEAQVSDLVAAAGDPRAGRIPQLAELTAKVRELETAYVQRSAQLKTELVQLLEQRFAQTGEQSETARSVLAQRTQATEQGLKSVTEETSALRTGLATLRTELDARFRQAAKPADIETAVGTVATRIASLETSVQAVTKSEQDRNATAGNILLSLELANLKRALDRGGRYGAELAAVQTLAAGRLDLSALKPHKDVGVPSLASLGAELGSLAHVMLDAEAQPAETTVGERFLSSFKSIVRVRRTDHPPGDPSSEAVIARAETALKEGRLGDALAETGKLPAKVTQPASVAAWLKRLSDRAAIDKALADLDTSLKTSLAGGAAPKAGATKP